MGFHPGETKTIDTFLLIFNFCYIISYQIKLLSFKISVIKMQVHSKKDEIKIIHIFLNKKSVLISDHIENSILTKVK